MDAKKAIIEYFTKRGKKLIPVGEEGELMGCHYLDAGIIDSLGLVMMITDFEKNFGIAFLAEDMQSYEFLTVGGLVAIVDRKLAAIK